MKTTQTVTQGSDTVWTNIPPHDRTVFLHNETVKKQQQQQQQQQQLQQQLQQQQHLHQQLQYQQQRLNPPMYYRRGTQPIGQPSSQTNVQKHSYRRRKLLY
jgi:hypothetical protein